MTIAGLAGETILTVKGTVSYEENERAEGNATYTWIDESTHAIEEDGVIRTATAGGF